MAIWKTVSLVFRPLKLAKYSFKIEEWFLILIDIFFLAIPRFLLWSSEVRFLLRIIFSVGIPTWKCWSWSSILGFWNPIYSISTEGPLKSTLWRHWRSKFISKFKFQVWLLTGDKQETAINIGHSCSLIKEGMPLIIINTLDLESTKKEIESKLKEFRWAFVKEKKFVLENSRPQNVLQGERQRGQG